MNLLDLMVRIGVDDQASSKVEGITSGAIAKGVAMGNAMWDVTKQVAGAVASAAKSVVGGAVEAYSTYEQMVGGVAKLYGSGQTLIAYAQEQGKAVSEVRDEYNALNPAVALMSENASKAWQTAGMSANQYMEQATGFSAALINSLGGDTQKAAEMTDVAMRAMSDNVNTFGSNMTDVQNAFQGFAKQNYTMLDNLKLGYGGTKEEMERKQKLLRDSVTTKKISLSWHDSSTSALEGALARGDRRMGEVVLKAFRLGAKMDSWGESFLEERWLEAFRQCGLDPAFYANRARGEEEINPWDHLDYGVSKDFLIREYRLARQACTTPNCREKCAGCGAAKYGKGVCFEKR